MIIDTIGEQIAALTTALTGAIWDGLATSAAWLSAPAFDWAWVVFPLASLLLGLVVAVAIHLYQDQVSEQGNHERNHADRPHPRCWRCQGTRA